jgi:2-deoxy-D-gluconate 3-dehydrogenase
VGEFEGLAHEIRAMGRNALVQWVDVTKANDIQAMVDLSIAKFGRMDIFVNNGGINMNKAALDMTEQDWDLALDTDLKGYLLASQPVGRHMVQQRKGRIINVSSTFGLVGFEKRGAYASGKGGVGQLTKVLSIEWGPHNINVNAIPPRPYVQRSMRSSLPMKLGRNLCWADCRTWRVRLFQMIKSRR